MDVDPFPAIDGDAPPLTPKHDGYAAVLGILVGDDAEVVGRIWIIEPGQMPVGPPGI
jgi:hypothetical protein